MARRHIPVPNESTSITGSVQISGLTIAGRISIVSIDNLTWTPLPATPLPQRNAISIQNSSGENIKYQYDNTTVGWVGVLLPPSCERFLDLTPSIIVYAKSQTGPVDITVEELS